MVIFDMNICQHFYIILDLNQSFKWRTPIHSNSSKNKWKTMISPSESTPSTNSPSLPPSSLPKPSKTLYYPFSNVNSILFSTHQKVGGLSRLRYHLRTRQRRVMRAYYPDHSLVLSIQSFFPILNRCVPTTKQW